MDFKCNQPDNYTFLERKSIITFDNNWLNDPSYYLEFFSSQDQQGNDEESLNILIQQNCIFEQNILNQHPIENLL